jgi:ribose transport system substrate-binding protein
VGTAVHSGAVRAMAFIDVAGAGRELAVRTPDVIEGGVDAEPQDIAIPTFVVTKESYDEFAKKYPDEVK